MYKIVKKRELNPTVTMMDIDAPFIARKAEPGQFIILRVDADGERIPLTVAGYDRQAGTVKIIFQIVGATTELLNHKKEAEDIAMFRHFWPMWMVKLIMVFYKKSYSAYD